MRLPILRMAIVVPVCGRVHETKAAWGCLIEMTEDKQAEVGLVVVDNGSDDGTADFLQRYVFRHFPHHSLIRNASNQGMAKSLNQGWRAIEASAYAFLHNDLLIYQPA